MPNDNPIKKIFDLYTSDLSYQEIERLIKREANEVYEFFKSDIPKPNPYQNKLTRSLIFARSLFNAFILRLTPARRIFYLIAILFFFAGFFEQIPLYLFASFLILNLLLAFELADKLTAKSEIEVARKIQFDLIPKHPTQIYNYQIATYYEPAREVGGDYFDVIENGERTYIVVGDISGKGMAAALHMVRVQAIIYQLMNYFTDIRDLMINLKKYFSKNLRKEYFLTITLASLEKDNTIKLSRAGHPPAIKFNTASNEIEVISPQGIGIGLNDKGVFERTLEVAEIKMNHGDILFLYSDGVTDTMNIMRDQFGDENVKRVIKNNSQKSAEEIKSALLNAIISFRGSANQHDDLTMVILKADHSPL